jgi:hypothetical protein
MAVPQHACDQCERTFTTPQGLSLHKIRGHQKLGGRGLPPKRSYTKKTSKIAAPAVSFCPCCGTNIRLFSQALAAIGGLQDG